MARGGWLLALGLVVAALAGQRLGACSMPYLEPSERLAKAPAIYRARVLLTHQFRVGQGYWTLLQVTEVWKGRAERLVLRNMGPGAGMCNIGYVEPGTELFLSSEPGFAFGPVDTLLIETYGKPHLPWPPFKVIGIPLLTLLLAGVGIRRLKRVKASQSEPS